MVIGHAEEITEEIDEARLSAIAFDCGTGRDLWRTIKGFHESVPIQDTVNLHK